MTPVFSVFFRLDFQGISFFLPQKTSIDLKMIPLVSTGSNNGIQAQVRFSDTEVVV